MAVDFNAEPAFGFTSPKVAPILTTTTCVGYVGSTLTLWRYITGQSLKLFPAISIIAGIFRIVVSLYAKFMQDLEEDDHHKFNGHIFRGLLEIANLGTALLIIDIITVKLSSEKKED